MRERPILFSGPMVRAILEGRKTQTRRVCKPAHIPVSEAPAGSVHPDGAGTGWIAWWPGLVSAEDTARIYSGDEGFPCPYGVVGDRLWVKETHSIGPGPDVSLLPGEDYGTLHWPHVTYVADGAIERCNVPWRGAFGRQRPSIHMPRWASRLLLEITEVRVERLQAINEVDAIAEGAYPPPAGTDDDGAHYDAGTFRNGFRTLWESLNGPGSWKSNPWVWALTFKRVTP